MCTQARRHARTNTKDLLNRNSFEFNRNCFEFTRNSFKLKRNVFELNRNSFIFNRSSLKFNRNPFKFNRNVFKSEWWISKFDRRSIKLSKIVEFREISRKRVFCSEPYHNLFIISTNKIIDVVTNGISQEIGRLTIGDLPWLLKSKNRPLCVDGFFVLCNRNGPDASVNFLYYVLIDPF